jgi:hypothetical protein
MSFGSSSSPVAFPSFANRVQISRDGGRRPQWRRDGRELFYLNDRALMTVSVTGPGANQFSEPKKLFDVPDSVFLGWPEFLNPFDLSGDGSTFFMTQRVAEQPETPKRTNVLLIQNWWEEFRGR